MSQPAFQIQGVPEGQGCLSVLIGTLPGAPIQASGNVPPKLIGASWATTYTWGVLYWNAGRAWCSYLKSDCGYSPPELWAVEGNFLNCPARWQELQPKQKAIA